MKEQLPNQDHSNEINESTQRAMKRPGCPHEYEDLQSNKQTTTPIS